MTRNIWSDRVEKITTEEFVEGIETIVKNNRGLATDEDGKYKYNMCMQGWFNGLRECADELEYLLNKLEK